MNYIKRGIKKILEKADRFRHNSLKLIKPKLYEPQGVILIYHQVAQQSNNSLGPYSSNLIAPQLFAEQMQYIKNNYRVISLDRLASLLEDDKRLPEKFVVITFDDGYKDNLTTALPILKKYNIPAAIYLSTSFIANEETPFEYRLADIIKNSTYLEFRFNNRLSVYDLNSNEQKVEAYYEIKELAQKTKKYKRELLLKRIANNAEKNNSKLDYDNLFMNWSEVQEIAQEELITIGAHTHTHPLLTTLARDEVSYEILLAKDILERRLETKVTHFSYPYGAANNRIIKEVERLNFKTAVTTAQELIQPRHKDSIYSLPRVEVEDTAALKNIF